MSHAGAGKRILSIDVGIVNLGLCLLQTRPHEPPVILKWESIDLLDRHRPCKQAGCEKVAKFTAPDGTALCKRCASRRSEPMVEAAWLAVGLPRCKKAELISLACRLGWTQAATMTKDELQEGLIAHRENQMIMPLPKVNAKDANLIALGRALHKSLEARPALTTADVVVIENQVSPIASRMKTIQGMLAQYFIQKSIPDIRFFSASNKLKPFLPAGRSTTYKERKALATSVTRELLTEQEHLDLFTSSNKKDDLADCFLQALALGTQSGWIESRYCEGLGARRT